METGNPKQVALLAVMAVGALGFLGSRFLGKSLPQVVLAATGGSKESVANSVSPIALSRDPFSHPKLASAPSKVEPEAATTTGPVASFGPLPKPGALMFGNAGAIGSNSLPLLEPVKPSKESIKPVPSTTSIVLEGVATATDSVAFISVGGADSQPFHEHDRIKGSIRLLHVNDGAIVISGPKGELTIGVGERTNL